jgi:hypothetical protein
MPVDNKTRKQNRLIQYQSILTNGSVSESPCEHCFSRGVDCVMDSKHRNCAECTRRGRKCAKKFHSESEWQKVLREQKKIDDELAQAEQQQMEIMMKIIRLRKQRQFLRTRNDRMLNHDAEIMEQLDAENPLSAEDLAELDRLADEDNARTLAATSENPTLTQMLEMNPLSPSFWGDLSFSMPGGVGGTAERAGGSPSGSR